MKKIVNSGYKPIPKLYSAELATFVNVLLQKHPKNRPSCKALLKLPAIKKIEDFIKSKNCHILRESEFQDSLSSSNFQTLGDENKLRKQQQTARRKSLMAKTIHFTGDFKDLDLKLRKLTKLKRLRENSILSDTSKFDIQGMKKQLERDTVKRYSRQSQRSKPAKIADESIQFKRDKVEKSPQNSQELSKKAKNRIRNVSQKMKVKKSSRNRNKKKELLPIEKVSRRNSPYASRKNSRSRNKLKQINKRPSRSPKNLSRSPNGSYENSVKLVNYSRQPSANQLNMISAKRKNF